MCAWFDKLRDRRGVAALEFALCAPIFIVIALGMLELGRAWTQSLALQKGLVAGVGFAARSALPVSGGAYASFENLVKRGSLDPSAPLVLGKWADGTASLVLTTSTFSGSGVIRPVLHAQASLPYDAMFPTLLHIVGLSDLRIDASYEQVHIGN